LDIYQTTLNRIALRGNHSGNCGEMNNSCTFTYECVEGGGVRDISHLVVCDVVANNLVALFSQAAR
jgi:hypothetical protein